MWREDSDNYDDDARQYYRAIRECPICENGHGRIFDRERMIVPCPDGGGSCTLETLHLNCDTCDHDWSYEHYL